MTDPEQAAAPSDPLVGQVIAGRYRLLERIGKGGMGAVYLGEHELTKRRCAIKTLLPGLWDSHQHYGFDASGPLLLSLGVTTIRDLGSDNHLDLETASATLGAVLKYREDADRVRDTLDLILAG